MNQINEWLASSKLSEIIKQQEESQKTKKIILCGLAIIGAVAAVAAIAYAVYRFLSKDKADDLEDDLDDDLDDEFDDEFFEDEDIFEEEEGQEKDGE